MAVSLNVLARRVRDFRPVALPPVDHEKTALPAREVRKGMALGLLEGPLSQVSLSVASGSLGTGLALMLGADAFALGILAALPVVGALVQVPAAWWIQRHGSRRRLTVIGSLGRQFWLVPAILLFVPLPAPIKLACFLLAIALGQMLLALAVNAWQSWMADLVPAAVRGRYFGTRGALVSATGMIVGYGGAWLIDRSEAVGLAAPAYASLLILAAACGSLGSILLARQPEPAMQRSTSLCLSALLSMPLHNPRFRRFASTFMLWQVALGVASPFMIAYGLTVLRLPLHMLALTETLTALTSVLTQPLWGKLADRMGHRYVLRLCMLLVVPMPWMWVLSTPTHIWPLIVGSLLSGITWSGIGVTQMSRLMEQTPADGQCSYFAAFAVATGVPFMVASFGAGALMSVVGTEAITLSSVHFHPYVAFFVASSVLRLATVILGWKSL